MRTMYDSVNPAALPASGDMYAAYVDGAYKNYSAVKARFPGKLVVSIAVFASTPGAQAYDTERGDLDPSQVPGVLMRERASGRNPSIYTSLDEWPEVVAACNAAGEP